MWVRFRISARPGARLIGWDIVRADLNELEDLILRYRPKLIWTNPTFPVGRHFANTAFR
jgi:hypothetical protein